MFMTGEQKLLQSVAMQLMNGEEVVLQKDDQKLRVKRVGSGRLRMVHFRLHSREFEAIEQNRNKPQPMGTTGTRETPGGPVRDVLTHKYVAVAVGAEITEYGK